MKVLLFLLIGLYFSLNSGLDCMPKEEAREHVIFMCGKHRYNRKLWRKVIECHRPLTDEFMRASSEANCHSPKFVLEPNNTLHSIEDVFFNICGMVQGNADQKAEATRCNDFGRRHPYQMSEKEEIRRIKEDFGPDSLCQMVRCVEFLNILPKEFLPLVQPYKQCYAFGVDGWLYPVGCRL